MTEQVIHVAQIPKPEVSKSETRETLARLCYFYPQYTLRQARRLPYRDVVLLLNTVRRQQAEDYYALTQIAAAPHTKTGVQSLLDIFNTKRARHG